LGLTQFILSGGSNQMRKKLLALITVLAMVFTMMVPAYAADENAVTLKIVHTNDVHSRVDGEAYVASYVKNLKDAGENVILVSAGDVLHGQPLATVSRGESIVNIMNAVGYDIMVPGNHDFNYGIGRLNELKNMMNFDLISANVKSASTGETVYEEGVIKEIAGIKVGFFGISSPETATKTNPKNVEGVLFEDPATAAADAVAALKEQGATVIVGVTHLGLDENTLEGERSTAVAAVEGVDLVIDGHSHTLLENGQATDNALIAQTGEYLENLGVVELTITDGAVTDAKASLAVVPTAEVPVEGWEASPEVLAVIDEVNAANEPIMSEVIGYTPVLLEGSREVVRVKESNLADLITDSMIAATGADVAITNGGGIRASIEAGDITKGDVLTVLPFGNFVCTVNVTGQAVIDALEHGVSGYPESFAPYSQVSGIKAEFDSTQPAGSRIVSVTLDDGTTLDPNATYTVATNDFMAVGGDDYTMLGVTDGYMEFGSLDEALIDYINSGVDMENIEMGRLVDVTGTAAVTAPETEAPAEEAPVLNASVAPLRQVAESLGFVVDWADGKVTLTKGELKASLETGVNAYTGFDGTVVELEGAPENIDGVLYVPASFFAVVLVEEAAAEAPVEEAEAVEASVEEAVEAVTEEAPVEEVTEDAPVEEVPAA
jgi:5'-nucleotidase